jgi:hypothetical protein
MIAEESSRVATWWLHGVSSLDRARPLALSATRDEGGSAAIATRVLRRVQRWLRQMQADGQPQNAEELLAYARRIERDMPSLAADLRAAALRHQASTR